MSIVESDPPADSSEPPLSVGSEHHIQDQMMSIDSPLNREPSPTVEESNDANLTVAANADLEVLPWLYRPDFVRLNTSLLTSVQILLKILSAPKLT